MRLIVSWNHRQNYDKIKISDDDYAKYDVKRDQPLPNEAKYEPKSQQQSPAMKKMTPDEMMAQLMSMMSSQSQFAMAAVSGSGPATASGVSSSHVAEVNVGSKDVVITNPGPETNEDILKRKGYEWSDALSGYSSGTTTLVVTKKGAVIPKSTLTSTDVLYDGENGELDDEVL